jgi:hypothetical protein
MFVMTPAKRMALPPQGLRTVFSNQRGRRRIVVLLARRQTPDAAAKREREGSNTRL